MRIEKESLKDFPFIKEEIHTDIKRIKRRTANIHRAVRLGNAFKNKVKIFFRNEEHSLHFVETTVWGAGKEFIELKGGITIPVKSIEKVDFS